MTPPSKAPNHFHGAHLKIRRAHEHIDALEEHVNAFKARKPYGILYEEDPGTQGHTRIVQRVVEIVPDDLLLSLGDAVHNLRASLDHAICGAVWAAGNSVTKSHRFPFFETGTLKQEIERCEIDAAGPAVVGIIRGINPSKSNQPALWALHALDILDKHKLLIPALAMVDVLGIRLAGAQHTIPSKFHRTTDIVNGTVYLSVPGRIGNWSLNSGIAQKFELQLPEATGVDPEPMVPALRELAKTVTKIVERIAATDS